MSAYPKYVPKAGQPSNLFKPIKVGDVELQQRIVMAPLSRLRSINHVPHELAPLYYSQRAESAGTLLITESTFISARAGGYSASPGFYTQEQIDSWKKVFEAVHEKKSFIFLQMWALGRAVVPEDMEKEGLELVSCSDVPITGRATPRPLTVEEIKSYINDYVTTAKRAIEAGADGVEIHCANGCLPDQFLRENTNHRTDQYGGSIENRARFVLEIVDGVIEAVGASRVGIRFSPYGEFAEIDPGISPIPQFSYIAAELERRGQEGNRLAYIHVVEPRTDGTLDYQGLPPVDLNSFIRFVWKGIIIRAGGIASFEHDVTNLDQRTLVALGRYFVSNPDLVEKLKTGTKYTEFHRPTFYWEQDKFEAHVGYTDYPKGYVASPGETETQP